MLPEILALAHTFGGFVPTSALLRLGLDSNGITALTRAGVVIRIRHGAYAPTSTWDEADPVRRHQVLARAVAHRHGGRVAVCGVSALVLRGVAVWDVDLSVVDVIRLDAGSSRREAGVRHHRGQAPAREVEMLDGIPVLSTRRSLWQALCSLDVEHGLVVSDSALHLGLLTLAELVEVAVEGAHCPGARHADLVIRLTDGRAESPGESRSRHHCWACALPAPTPQLVVIDRRGRKVGRSDLGWEEWRHLLEFDGRIKYGRLLLPGETPEQAVVREKRREDAMRAEGWGMTRLCWEDLSPTRRAATADRIRADLERSRALFGSLAGVPSSVRARSGR